MRACATKVLATPSVTLSKSFRCYGVLCLMKHISWSVHSPYATESYSPISTKHTWHVLPWARRLHFSPRKVWTNDTCDQASKDATCSQYCSQPQWARWAPKWDMCLDYATPEMALGVAIFMPVRLCPEYPGARTQYFGLSWVQHLSSNMQVLFKFCECKRTTKIFKITENLRYDVSTYNINIYIYIHGCMPLFV